MRIVLLSGGSGKRLWPLSNEVRSKQFIKIFKSPSGELESMVQRIYRGIRKAVSNVEVTVSTGKTQVSSLTNQLGDSIDICVEPARRDTFPAIALAMAYLKDVKGVSEDEAVVVCPVDPFVEDEYFDKLRELGEAASRSEANIMLMGIKPTYPSEKYGYICAREDGRVLSFKEKPDLEGAKKLVKEGALWNGGVFAFKLGYMLKKAHELIDFKDYSDLKGKYADVTKISIDYAVVEHEKDIRVITYEGQWKDLGTWNTLSEAMESETIGNVFMDDTCENTNIVNEMDVPVLGMGLKNIVVAASADGILVADKAQSSYMKPLVDKIDAPVMYAEKSWGSYRVLDVEATSIVVKVTLMPGHQMNYHSHERRDEIWNICSGEGEVIIDGDHRPVKAGDTIAIAAGSKHTIIAKTVLIVTETQIGADIDVRDKTKFDME